MASLAAALKNAIQVEFQLEDAELAAEPLPDRTAGAVILFYEAAEGGAGVLRRLVAEPDALPRGRPRRRSSSATSIPTPARTCGGAPGAKEACEAACYDCLLSYGNQRDHRLLDRKRDPATCCSGSRRRRRGLRHAVTRPRSTSRRSRPGGLRASSASGSTSCTDRGHALPTAAQQR